VDQQDGISTQSRGQASVHNDDFVGIVSYNIFVGIAVTTIFGSGFFFDLFWPERTESKSIRLTWKICYVAVSFMALAEAIALTVRGAICNIQRSTIDSYCNRLLLPHAGHTSQEYRPSTQRSFSCRADPLPQYTAGTQNVLHQQ